MRRAWLEIVALAGASAVLTMLCVQALARGGASSPGWVLGLLGAVLVTHVLAALACHGGFFRDLQALDRARDSERSDRDALVRGFARVANAPRYWFVRAILWFAIGSLDVALVRHAVDPEAFPWISVVVRTTGSLAGAFLFGALVFFLLKHRLAALRSALGAAIGDSEVSRRLVRPVSIRRKVVVGVGGALLVATLYGAVLAKVQGDHTAEATAVALAGRVLDRLAAGGDVDALGEQARSFGILERIVVLDPSEDPSFSTLDPWLAPFEVAHLRDAQSGRGDSRRTESIHDFAWRTLPDGRVAVSIAPEALFGAHVPPMSGALGAFLVTVLAVTLAVAGLLAADVEGSVAELAGEVGRLAAGDLRPVALHFWEDELGQLEDQLDHMAGSLGAMIVGVRATADRVEAAAAGIGEASARLLGTRDEQVAGNAELRTSILGVSGQVDGIRTSARDLTASVEEGSSSILELRGTGQQLDQNASVLSAKVDEVSSSVEELIHSVRDVLENAEHLSGAAVDTSSSMEEMAASLREMDANAVETARLSTEMVDRAENGRQKVHETLKGMERIDETTRMAQGVIHGLGARTQEIGAIVNVIDDVAEETNLLALNAAIIAAQAGENGRSFSVVADEIKKLADRVLSSTKEIEQVITAVQQEAAKAVDAIEQGGRVVGQGVTRAEQAGEALDVITASARDSGGRIAEIVAAVTEQTKAAGHVVGLMDRVRAGVDHIRRAGMEQDRGNESVLASTEVMREIAGRVRQTTGEQAQGAGRIAEGVESVSLAVERINSSLSEQSGACESAEAELARSEQRTHTQGELALELDRAVGRMRESSDQLRDAVGRFQA